MSTEIISPRAKHKIIVKKCHVCGEIIESLKEVEKCPRCKKSFLPSNYFGKVHAKNSNDFKQLFSTVSDLHDEDLIRGLAAIW